MSKNSVKGAMLAILTTAVGLLATDADASYTGAITRSVCASGHFVKAKADASYWDFGSENACGMEVTDAGSVWNFHFGNISIPREATSSQNTTVTLRVWGGADSVSQICGNLIAYDSSGSINGSTGYSCSVGSVANNQTITLGALSVPANGENLVQIKGQDGSSVTRVAAAWTANGS